MDRIVTLVDMDCFYCQVEARLNPSLKGKPLAVVQYNQWKGGGIIAVNYEARSFGVTRSMRGAEAKQKCPDIILVSVASVRGKADLTKYRDAGREVVDVFCQFSDCVERASVDEAYIDITRVVDKKMNSISRVQPSQLGTTFVVGFSEEDNNNEDTRQQGIASWLDNMYELQDEAQMRLAVAGMIVEEMRAAVYEQTGFRCSAGISHNKILGKLACGLHKPNRQTILPQAGVAQLFKTLPIRKVRSLGGKFGCIVEEQLGCSAMADLLRFSEQQLQNKFDEKTGTWLYQMARGINHDPVTPRLVSKSIGCCKQFPGRQALATRTDVQYWLEQLAGEVAERLAKDLEENKRRAKLLTVSYMQDSACSRSGPLTSYDAQKIAADAFDIVKKSNTGNQESWFPPLKFLGISVGKFVDESSNQNSTLLNYFKAAQKESNMGNNKEAQAVQIEPYSEEKTETEDVKKESDMEEKMKLQTVENGPSTDERDQKSEEQNATKKTSFFLRYLQKKALGQSILKDKSLDSDEDLFKQDSTDSVNKILHPIDSTCKAESSVNKTENSRLQINVDSAGPSTSRVEDEEEKLCVSLSEIFPDLNEIDDDVVQLLPESLQQRLQDRIRNSVATSSKWGDDEMKESSILNGANLNKIQGGIGKGKGLKIKKKSAVSCAVQKSSEENAVILQDKKMIPNCVRRSSRQQSCNAENGQEKLEVVNSTAESDFQATSDYKPPHVESHEKENLPSTVNSKNRLPLKADLDSITVCTDEAEDRSTSCELLVEKCPQCSEVIPLGDYLEHLDFHAAQELHKELNKPATPRKTPKPATPRKTPKPVTPRKTPAYELPVRKRGRPSKKATVVKDNKKMKSITAFFTPNAKS